MLVIYLVQICKYPLKDFFMAKTSLYLIFLMIIKISLAGFLTSLIFLKKNAEYSDQTRLIAETLYRFIVFDMPVHIIMLIIIASAQGGFQLYLFIKELVGASPMNRSVEESQLLKTSEKEEKKRQKLNQLSTVLDKVHRSQKCFQYGSLVYDIYVFAVLIMGLAFLSYSLYKHARDPESKQQSLN